MTRIHFAQADSAGAETMPREHRGSSQFASALLLSAEVGGWDIEIEGENADESPYVVMTQRLIAAFPKNKAARFKSSRTRAAGVIFWAAQIIVPYGPEYMEFSKRFGGGSSDNDAKQGNSRELARLGMANR